jgi:ABC-type phosphate transport system permease subunit
LRRAKVFEKNNVTVWDKQHAANYGTSDNSIIQKHLFCCGLDLNQHTLSGTQFHTMEFRPRERKGLSCHDVPAYHGTYHAMIITYVTFNLPVCTWLMRGYFDSISTSLEESAFIDGCSRTSALIRIVGPIAIPGIVTIAILTFIMSWNEILFASVLTNDVTKTVALGIRDYRSKLNSIGTT